MEAKEKVKDLLENWLDQETGEGLFKFTGMFWEALHPLMQKHQPELLAKYSNLLGESFDYFNPKVKALCAGLTEEELLSKTLDYYSARLEYSTANDPHILSFDEDDVVAYLPNQSIDQGQYFGREGEGNE